MKEAFEKIIERLEELIEQTYYKAVDGDTEAGIRNMVYHRAKAIVNQVAEEYNDGWIPVSERLPDGDREVYIVQKTNGSIDILGFTKDAYKLDKYDFAEYKGKKKPIFYDYDSEYGYIECECEAWMPRPTSYKPKEN